MDSEFLSLKPFFKLGCQSLKSCKRGLPPVVIQYLNFYTDIFKKE
jgi:hypothetical protein